MHDAVHSTYPASAIESPNISAGFNHSIENGTPGCRLEWASYLMTQGAHMAPLRNGPATRVANEADISFKRWALEDVEDDPLGFMTIRHLRALADSGALMVNDDRIQVNHNESLSPRATAVSWGSQR